MRRKDSASRSSRTCGAGSRAFANDRQRCAPTQGPPRSTRRTPSPRSRDASSLDRPPAERSASWVRAAAGGARAVLLASLMLLLAAAPSAAEELRVDGTSEQLEFERNAYGGGAPQILEGVRRSADIVSAYYGRFPVTRLTLRLISQDGAGVHGGKTFANPNAFIRVQLGREVTPEQL